jgi:NADH-quinone oxidoreductase subunit N
MNALLLASPALRALLPVEIVAAAALAALALDVSVLRGCTLRTRTTAAALLGILGCIVSIVLLLHAPTQIHVAGGMLAVSALTALVQAAILALTVCVLLLLPDAPGTRHAGETVLLILFATAGMLLLAAAQDLLLIFLALELLSLPLYILTALDARPGAHGAHAAEAALKYFLFGGVSSAMLLFGFSLLYGVANSTRLAAIAIVVHTMPLHPLVLAATALIVAGLGFKIAAAPFHFWAPDVYEAAPAPAAALIASGSKVAAFFFLFQVLTLGLTNARAWAPVLVVLAALSMTIGSVAATVQTSVRRLLAYSAIAHAGYMLLAFLPGARVNLSALLFYVLTYALAALGMFAAIGVLERTAGTDSLQAWQGLSQRSPLLAASVAIFLFSLAGVPPLSGFFAKFYLFASVLKSAPFASAAFWLVLLAIAMSAVALYYSLRILKPVFVAASAEGASAIRIPALSALVLLLLTAAVVVLGCAPQLLLRWIECAMQTAGMH